MNTLLDAAAIRPVNIENGLDLLTLDQEDLIFALPAAHALAGQKEVPLQALGQGPFVVFSSDVGVSFRAAFIAACQSAGFEPELAQEAGQISSTLNLVAIGFGVALVPASIA